MYVLHVEQMLTKTKPKDIQEIKGCSGNRGMFRKSRDVQEIKGCSRNQGMFRKSRDVQEIKGNLIHYTYLMAEIVYFSNN